MMQSEIFWQGEGDSWFARNKDKLTVERAIIDFPIQLLERTGVMPKRVAEVGCANGYQLEAIRQKYGAECVGIDVSGQAIGAGSLAYPNLSLRRGSAIDFNWALRDHYSLVVVSFVFHWLDRRDIWLAADTVGDLLRDGGYLLLADFLPDYPCRRPYKHKEDVWTYKLDYGALFVASGLYREVARIVIDHDRHIIDPNAAHDVRACYWLLQKDDYYKCE